MTRIRLKMILLGLALATGASAGADGIWYAADDKSNPKRTSPKNDSTTAVQPSESKAIWHPVRPPEAAAIAPIGGIEVAAPLEPASFELHGPRSESLHEWIPLPRIAPFPGTVTAPPAAVLTEAPRPDPALLPAPQVHLELPIPVVPQPPELPMLPDKSSEEPLGIPRPVVPESQAELPTAPLEWMCPVGGKRERIGSPPIRLTSDYPPLRDLLKQCHIENDLTLLSTTGDYTPDQYRYFLSSEYLLWWMPGFAIPVLGATNTNPAAGGFLGEVGTSAIVGPGRLIENTRSGFRVRAGAWMDESSSCGIDGSFFFLGSRSAATTVDSSRFPLITRPVFLPNPLPGTGLPIGENGESVALPGTLTGALLVRGTSELWGADLNIRQCLHDSCTVRANGFLGYRYLNLRETLTITEDITVIGPGNGRIPDIDPIGTKVFVEDRFATRNQFHGGQFGMDYERRMNRWSLSTRAAIALGTTYQNLDIKGSQLRVPPGAAPMMFSGGLLAAGPNLGTFTRNRFSVIPEATINLAYNVSDNLRFFTGYNFLLWTNVIRPGDQIDRVVDLTFVPNAPPAEFSGLARPSPHFKQRDLVIQGVQFGMELRW